MNNIHFLVYFSTAKIQHVFELQEKKRFLGKKNRSTSEAGRCGGVPCEAIREAAGWQFPVLLAFCFRLKIVINKGYK
jgi:hypothetical protein